MPERCPIRGLKSLGNQSCQIPVCQWISVSNQLASEVKSPPSKFILIRPLHSRVRVDNTRKESLFGFGFGYVHPILPCVVFFFYISYQVMRYFLEMCRSYRKPRRRRRSPLRKIRAIFILQGNIKGVSQLCVLSTLGFLHLIPKCFPVAKPLWRVRWEQNFAVQYTVLWRLLPTRLYVGVPGFIVGLTEQTK